MTITQNKQAMIDGLVAIGTRANGKKTITQEQANSLVQSHTSDAIPHLNEQRKAVHLPQNHRDFSANQSTSSSDVVPTMQHQGDQMQPTHQQEQSMPTLDTQCKESLHQDSSSRS